MAANNMKSGETLQQAKDALIAYAVSDENRPGELPCPDVDNDGSLTLNVDYTGGAGNPCTSLVGRLPWKALGIPDLRDPSGERLWYAVSDPFHAGASATLNSETTGTITLTGTASNLIAIVFAPGRPLSGQSRITANENNYSHYLESVDTPATIFHQSTPNDHEGGAYTYNDHLVYITHNNLLPLVEKRIARETKKCLDTYAASSFNKYPWPALVSTGAYVATSGTLFGRVPTIPTLNSTYTPTDPWIIDMLDYLVDLQTALDAFAANNNATTRSNLDNVGNNLNNVADDIVDATSPAYPANVVAVATPAKSAGSRAEHLANGDVHWDGTPYTVADVQYRIDQANAALSSLSTTPEDPQLQPTWPSGCFTASYWSSWKSQVFYQVASGYKPGTVSPACGGSCLSVSTNGVANTGSGSYRAVVVVAGKKVGTQTRAAQTVDQYLEGGNQNNRDVAPFSNLSFVTYRSSDTGFSTLNDQTACLDGNINCN
ncbi:MAG: hypothetical protein HZB95_10360 [Nitrosomonadales bacterium]|nr:hypothetical protein [Nitrosomonadales bacterium]